MNITQYNKRFKDMYCTISSDFWILNVNFCTILRQKVMVMHKLRQSDSKKFDVTDSGVIDMGARGKCSPGSS